MRRGPKSKGAPLPTNPTPRALQGLDAHHWPPKLNRPHLCFWRNVVGEYVIPRRLLSFANGRAEESPFHTAAGAVYSYCARSAVSPALRQRPCPWQNHVRKSHRMAVSSKQSLLEEGRLFPMVHGLGPD